MKVLKQPGLRAVVLALGVLLAMTVSAMTCAAQDDEDVTSAADGADSPASLFLRLERQGNVYANLELPEGSTVSDTLTAALVQTLYCAPGKFRGNDSADGLRSIAKNWSAAQRENYQKSLAKYEQRHVAGTCYSAMARRDGVVQADIEYSQLVKELKRAGADRFILSLDVPQAPFRDYSRTYLTQDITPGMPFLTYEIPLESNASAAAIHIAFGLRHSDVNRGFAILAGFILLPVFVTLWMRRSALASAKIDAAAAWFGFFRTLNWILTGTMLLWVTSSLGARAILREWIADHGYSSWAAAGLDALIALGPVFLTYFLCIALSYPLHTELRGSQYTRREFLVSHGVMTFAKALPWMLALALLEMTREQLELSVVLLGVNLVLMQLLQIVKLRVLKSAPQPVTTGELREKILALAARLQVQVKQILVLPAGKGQVANAYAAKGKAVMFTDYLLLHLTKPEVEGIAAHELAHLKYKHPTKRGIAFLVVIFSPAIFSWLRQIFFGLLVPFGFLSGENATFTHWLWSAMTVFDHWSQRDFVLVMLGMTGFYFLARHHENVADETAVRLTGNAEAQITGLLKVNRLNFVPIQWGKVTESWVTHPSTMRRVERMAAVGGLPPERLEQILAQYKSESLQGSAALPPVAVEDRYPAPDAGDAETVKAAVNRRVLILLKVWALRLTMVLVPTLVAVLARHFHIMYVAGLALYLAGFVLAVALVVVMGFWFTALGNGRERQRLTQRFERELLPVGRPEDAFVGIAPTPVPRLFGASYHWDSGFFVFSRDRLQFVGERAKFSLAAADIDSVVIGPGGPSWYKFQRVYLRWKDASTGRSGIFNLYPLNPGSIWHSRARVRALYESLQSWHTNSSSYPETRPELFALTGPSIGEVQCVSPALIGKLRPNLKEVVSAFPLLLAAVFLFRAQFGYLLYTMFGVRLFQVIPYWRYRDRPPLAPHPAEAVKARGASI